MRAAIAAFSMQNPSESVPSLARGLAATRRAIDALRAEPDAAFILQVKEQQFMDAIGTALGIDFEPIEDGTARQRFPAGLAHDQHP